MKTGETNRRKALEGRRILVVDDEDDALRFISMVLEDEGATVLKAADGDEALAVARKEKPELMTLDLAMPGKNGIDVYLEMRQDPDLRGLPVCIVTGRPEMRKLIYDRENVPAPEGYMSKPVKDATLVMNVRRILEVAERKATPRPRPGAG